MNLWVKKTGQLLMAALFMMACENEASLLGFNQNKRFAVKYIEIPLESSVFLADSIQAFKIFAGEYADPVFGTARATGYAQIRSLTSSQVDASAIVDSVTLEFRLDYYTYGNAGESVQTFEIHEITKTLYSDSAYITRSPIPYSSTVLGTGSALVNSVYFNTQFAKSNNEKDTSVVRFALDKSYGEKLISNDTVFGKFTEFRKYINGLAIVPLSSNRIVGFDLLNNLDQGSRISKLVVHYHTASDTLEQVFLLDVGVQLTGIEADRSGTNLSGLTNFYQEDQAIKDSDLRYSQIGTGIITKVDLNNFLSFSDTISTMVINSAELKIENLESVDSYVPINAFSLQVLKDDNRLRRVGRDKVLLRDSKGDTLKVGGVPQYTYPVTATDQAELNKYNGRITAVNEFFAAIGDAGVFYLSKPSSSNTYSGYLTLALQQLYLVNKLYQEGKYDKGPLKNFALYPVDPFIGNGLNRIIFNKNNFKLKLYYTTPTTVNN